MNPQWRIFANAHVTQTGSFSREHGRQPGGRQLLVAVHQQPPGLDASVRDWLGCPPPAHCWTIWKRHSPTWGRSRFRGVARPIPLRKPAYGEVLRLRIRALGDADRIGEEKDPKKLSKHEQSVRTLELLDARARFEVDLVRACVVGGFAEGERAWSDDRIRDFLERTTDKEGENPLVRACEIAAGLRIEEVGGEDDPFGSRRSTDGR